MTTDTNTAEAPNEAFDPLNRGRSLYRTSDHVGGVAGGLAEYLGIDPSLTRIGTAALILSTGPAALAAYAAAWMFLPDRDGSTIIGDDAAPASSPEANSSPIETSSVQDDVTGAATS